jgi:predicted nucleotidyltransferase
MGPRQELPSGLFVLRLPPALHAQLAASAQRRGVSLNEHCVGRLALAESVDGGPFAGVIAKAIGQLGVDLVAVAIFGSWARGEAGPSSDIDLLLVVASGVEVTRDLYTPWDEDDAHVGVHRVEPHFVRLPLPGDEVTGLWAEIALDGAVIYDPELVLARELVRIRRSILGGALERRTAGGHSWWSAV